MDRAVAAGMRSVLEVAADAVADPEDKVVGVLGIAVLLSVLVCRGESIDFFLFTWRDQFPPLMPGGTVASWCWFSGPGSAL